MQESSDSEIMGKPIVSGLSRRAQIMRKLTFIVPVIILSVIILMAIFADLAWLGFPDVRLAPYDPEKMSLPFQEEKTEQRFHPIILKAAHRFQVDPALVKAIIMAESGYDPTATSKMGDKGLMQLMPATAEELGVEDSFNPKQNINAGVGYFKKLLNKFEGDVELALAAYNAGVTKVRQYQGIPPYKATRCYIKKVFEYYQTYKKQMASESEQA